MPIYTLTTLAAAEAEAQVDLFSSIGVDWKLLVLQTIAFLLLLFLLKKLVYPSLVGMLDRREKQISESVAAARDAEKNAAEAEAKTAKLMKKARKDADELLSSAKAEATALVSGAEKKSRDRAEQIMNDAEAEVTRSVEAAKKALRAEAVALVADATEKVVGGAVSTPIDKKIIETAVQEADAA